MRTKALLPLSSFAAIVFAILALLGAARSARADTIITVCDEANLSAALAAGGVIYLGMLPFSVRSYLTLKQEAEALVEHVAEPAQPTHAP